MTSDFVLPAYGGNSLANVLPSIEARLDGTTPLIELPVASRYVVFLVDGLGWYPLERHRDHAETLGAALPGATALTCSVPSTTATSLTSLGCGVPPGRHGVVGYTFVDPATDQVMNALSWEGGPADVDAFSCHETAFQRLAESGRGSGAVSLARFSDSALTRLAFGGTEHHEVEIESDPEHFTALVREALAENDVVYCYERMLDHDGHGYGVESWRWLDRLGRIDDMVAELVDSLPADVCLLVTGDHGMVDVPVEHKIVAEDHAELAGARHIAGEARFRQLYADDPEGLAAAWRAFLGDRAHVALKAEAIAAGWFGPEVDEPAAARLGDVLVAMRGDWGIMSTSFPGEFGLVGMHGSMTPEEMIVPLFTFGPR